MREVGVYYVGCSGYGYLFFSQSHNRKISREIDINKKADNHRHKHKTKNRSKHKQNCNVRPVSSRDLFFPVDILNK